MERAGLFGVDDMAFVEEIVVSKLTPGFTIMACLHFRVLNHLVPEEATGDVDFFATNDDNLLARENLLGNNRRQPTQKMALAIYDDGRRRKSGHVESLVAS